MQRVLVAGSSGAGRTTMAVALAERLGLPHTEMDALWHGPGWVPRPDFDADVRAMLAPGRWVTEYQYRTVKADLLAAAEAVVWLEHPAGRGVVVVRLRGARQARRWLGAR